MVWRLWRRKVAVDDSSLNGHGLQGATGEVIATIPTAEYNPVNGMHALDALVLEPHSGLLAAINGDQRWCCSSTSHASRRTVSIGGKPEFAAAMQGGLYINVNRGKTNEIVAVDCARKVVKHIPLKAARSDRVSFTIGR